MKKILLAALCIAMAVPAFAVDTQLNGFFRTKMYYHNLSHFKKDQPDSQYVDQRFRAKATLNMNEYVSVVYYGEIDMVWGDNSYGIGGTTRNKGGGIGGDTVNLETKNLYATLKIPETPVGVTLGLQGYYDNFSGVVFIADMAGVKVAGKLGPVSGNVAYMKWQEAALNNEDDIDLYATQLAFVPAGMEALTIGLDAYWFNQNGAYDGKTSLKPQPVVAAFLADVNGTVNSGDVYFIGPQVSYKMDNMDFSAWLLYEGGSVTVDWSDPETGETGSEDLDLAAWAANLKGNFSVADAKLTAQAMWFSAAGDDDSKWKGMLIPTTGELGPFGDSGMMIFFGDPFTTTFGPEGDLNGWAMDDAVYGGYGLWALCLSGSYSPPAMKDLYFKAAVGYFSAVDDTYQGTEELEGKTLGFEGTLRVGIKIAKVADFSLNGAAASLGNFYDKSTASGDDPDNPWMTYAMLNVNW